MGHKHKPRIEKGGDVERKVYGTNPTADKKEWGADQRKEEDVTCSLVQDCKVLIGLTPKQKIVILMEEYTSKEWLGYLVGRVTGEGHFIVDDLVIPPHKEASCASAEAEPFHVPNNCVGVIHSHHRMGAFHSGTDDTHVDRNFPLSITVAKAYNEEKLTYNAVSFKQTPCGRMVKVTVEVKYLSPEPSFEVEAWFNESKANIEKGTPPVKVYGNYAGYPNYNCPATHDRAAINKMEDTEQAKLPEDKPPMIVVTKKMVDRLAAKVFNEQRILLPRATLEDMLAKDPTLCLDTADDTLGLVEGRWSC